MITRPLGITPRKCVANALAFTAAKLSYPKAMVHRAVPSLALFGARRATYLLTRCIDTAYMMVSARQKASTPSFTRLIAARPIARYVGIVVRPTRVVRTGITSKDSRKPRPDPPVVKT